MPNEPENLDGVRILGQVINYPKSICATIAVIFVSAAIVLTVYLVLHAEPGHVRAVRALWSSIEVAPDGSQTIQHDTMRMEFWTPSSKTKFHLRDDDEKQWEGITNEVPVEEFGRILRMDPNVTGYRRSEVWGRGRTNLKPGWWWTMTVRTNYSVTKLVSAYTNFWKSQGPVFVEVIDNKGHYEQ
jgi:hypothetical protein